MRSTIIPIIVAIILIAFSWTNAISTAADELAVIENVLEKAKYNESLGVYKIAIDEYRKLVRMNPEDISNYHKVIDLSFNTNRFLIFDEYSRKAIKAFPNDPKAYLDLCNYYYSNDDSKRVVEIALKANRNLNDSDVFKEMYFEMAYRYKMLGGQYESVRNFVGNYAPVLDNEKWGLLTNSGSYRIKPQYENISVMSSSKVAVDNGDEVYYINKVNEKILACVESVDEAYPFIGGLAVVKQGDLYGYATSKFELRDVQWEFATSYLNGVAAVKKDGKWAIRDFNREMVTDFIYDDVIFDENLICSNAKAIFVKENNLYYLIGIDGEKVLDIGFEDAKPFTAEGIAPVKKDGKWGFISSSGGKVIEATYDDANAFELGIAPVKKDGKWFYIDNSERVVIEGDFEEARSFSDNGIAPVKVDGYWTFIKLLSAK